VEDQSGPISGERTSELGGIIIVVVRRAQLGTNPGHPLDREMSKLGRIICIVERAVLPQKKVKVEAQVEH